MEMPMVKPKTDVKISVDDNDSLIDVIKKVIKALKRAGKDKQSREFQRAACNGERDFMDVVREFVTIQ